MDVYVKKSQQTSCCICLSSILTLFRGGHGTPLIVQTDVEQEEEGKPLASGLILNG